MDEATAFLKKRGVLYLSSISPTDIRAYLDHLQTVVSTRGPNAGKQLKRTTQRQYIDALGYMLQRALSEGRIPRNWVRERIDLPIPGPSPTQLLELHECALLLESARRLFPADRPGPPIYPLLAFLLLTGCSESERAGVELQDIRLPGDPEYPAGVVLIRPNSSRSHLKTVHRERGIPLHPQLAEILAQYLASPNAPPGPLLFSDPAGDGGTRLGDWRRSLDQVAKGAGFEPGEVRARRFRVSYASHRLTTLDEHGLPMTAWRLRGEMGHSSEQMIEQRYGRYAKYRARRPVLEFRWDEWRDRWGSRLSVGLASLLSSAERAAIHLLASQPDGLTREEWEHALDLADSDRLVQFEFAAPDATLGERIFVTADGRAVLRAAGTPSGHPLSAALQEAGHGRP